MGLNSSVSCVGILGEVMTGEGARASGFGGTAGGWDEGMGGRDNASGLTRRGSVGRTALLDDAVRRGGYMCFGGGLRPIVMTPTVGLGVLGAFSSGLPSMSCCAALVALVEFKEKAAMRSSNVSGSSSPSSSDDTEVALVEGSLGRGGEVLRRSSSVKGLVAGGAGGERGAENWGRWTSGGDLGTCTRSFAFGDEGGVILDEVSGSGWNGGAGRGSTFGDRIVLNSGTLFGVGGLGLGLASGVLATGGAAFGGDGGGEV